VPVVCPWLVPLVGAAGNVRVVEVTSGWESGCAGGF